MQNMPGVKHPNMPAKQLSPCPKTLPGEVFKWAQYSTVPSTTLQVGEQG